MLLYNKRKVITSSDAEEFYELAKNTEPGQPTRINIKNYPDIEAKLLEMTNSLDPEPDVRKYYIREAKVERFIKGQGMDKGTDIIDPKATHPGKIRAFTIRTRIYASDDLEGGLFVVYTKDGYVGDVHLEVGDSLMYRTTNEYKIAKVTNGELANLVCYVHRHR